MKLDLLLLFFGIWSMRKPWMQEMNLILINDRFFHSAKKKKKEKRTGSFKLFDNWHSGPRKFKGDFFFFFLQERKPYPFYFYIRVYVQQVFCFLLLFFILFYFMEVGLFVRFTLKCHNNRTRRNFRFTYCLYAKYCRK